MRKILVSSVVALSILTMGTVALANSNILNQKAIAIDGSGNIALSGTVTVVSGSTISVNSWLGTWAVNASAATFSPANTTLADVKVGDTVKVAGALGTGMVINATAIKDISLIQPKNKENNGAKANFKFNFGWFKNLFKR